MATSFAGSRSLDERRRRRLATENDQIDYAQPTTAPQQSDDAAGHSEVPASQLISVLHLRKFVSNRVWKIVCLSCFSLLCGVGIQTTGWYIGQHSQPTFQTGLVHLFDVSNSRVGNFYQLVHIVIAGQLCLFISWIRSKSLADFTGRFRIWKWAGLCIFAVTFAQLTSLYDAYLSVMSAIQEKKALAYSPLTYWLVPCLGIGSLVFLRLQSEMRSCKTSRSFLWLAVLTWGAAWGLKSNPQFALPTPAWSQQIVQSSLSMAGHWCLFTSLIIHTRFVTYVSIDPPQRRNGNGLLRRLFSRQADVDDDQDITSSKKTVSKKTVKKASTAKRTTNSATTNSKSTKPKQTTKVESSTKNSKAKKTANQDVDSVGDADMAEPEPISTRKSKKKKPTRQPSENSTPDVIPIDGPDPNALKGLSKRERRQLRKQWREQQNEEQGGRRAA